MNRHFPSWDSVCVPLIPAEWEHSFHRLKSSLVRNSEQYSCWQCCSAMDEIGINGVVDGTGDGAVGCFGCGKARELLRGGGLLGREARGAGREAGGSGREAGSLGRGGGRREGGALTSMEPAGGSEGETGLNLTFCFGCFFLTERSNLFCLKSGILSITDFPSSWS